jgi:hypothetical protein
MKKLLSLYFCLCLFVQCGKDSTTEPGGNPDPASHTISGIIIDQASSEGLSGTIVKIGNIQNTYKTTTEASGSFSFKNIQDGEYQLSTVTIQNRKILTDTCGMFHTDSSDWGIVYSQTFASISGTIKLEGQTDCSFINVQLLGTDKSAVTTNQGKFRIDFIFPDTYDLYISMDNDYKEIRINDLTIDQGDLFVVDTMLIRRFKQIEIEESTSLSFLNEKSTRFCYANGYFWYCRDYIISDSINEFVSSGFFRNDPLTQLEEPVYTVPGMGYLDIEFLSYDYNDGMWLGREMADTIWHQSAYEIRYSIASNSITDSINIDSFPCWNCGGIACDPVSHTLVFFELNTSSLKITCYDPATKNYETSVLPFIEYDISQFKRISLLEVFIDPSGKLYLLLLLKDLYDQISYNIYTCNGIKDGSQIRIYKSPGGIFSFFYYNNDMYAFINDRIYRLLF